MKTSFSFFINLSIASFFSLLILTNIALSDSSSGLWHKTDMDEKLGVWYYGQDSTKNYNTGSKNSGILSIDLSIGSDPTVTIDTKYQTEGGSTYDKLRIDIEGNTIWERPKKESKDANDNFGWETLSFSLDDYINSEVSLTFSFDTVDSVANTYFGWAIHNIQVATGTEPDPVIIISEFITRCTATYDQESSSLIIPCLNLDDASYWAELAVNLATDPVSLLLQNMAPNIANTLPGPGEMGTPVPTQAIPFSAELLQTQCVATYDPDNGAVTIPCLDIHGASYWTELAVNLATDPVSLLLQNMAQNIIGNLPGPESTPVPTPTITAIPTPTITAVPTPTITAIPTPTITAIPTPTITAVPTPTITAVPTPTITAVPTPTITAIPTPTITAIPTAIPVTIPAF